MTVEWKVSTAASIATLGAVATVNGTPVGSELVNAAEPTTDTSQSFAIPGLTRAQLLNGAFGVRVRATRGNSNTAFTASLDAVSVRVDYTSANVTAITVNAVGATTARGTDTFTYDQANRLRTATVAGISETSTYDGDGVRFSRQVGAGPLIRLVTDPTVGLPVTIDDGTRKYVWGASGLAYAVAGTAVEVQHADRLGSVRAVSDGTGAVIATYRTDEFGIPTSSTGASGSPFRYTGEPTDASGLTYLRARYYDASVGRFLSRDPFAGFASSPLSLNRYSYVENNPATWSDPSGRCIGPLIIVCIGVAVGVASYVGGTVATNFVQQKDDLTEGLNATDLVISGVAGGISGGVGPSLSIGGKILINAIIGFDATLTSMVAGRRTDPAELAVGTLGGGLGGALDFRSGGSGVTGALRGLAGSGFLGSGLTTVQNILAGIFGQQPHSSGMSPPSYRLAGSRAAGK